MSEDITKDFFVHYYEVDYYKRATPWSLLNYLQETAFYHADCAGDTQEVLASQQLTWMIYKWHLTIHSYPCWKDMITVRTWISGYKSYMVLREFEIIGSDGAVLAEAGALAILVDTIKNSPRKIDPHRRSAYGVDPNRQVHHKYENFNFERKGACKQSFLVRISDIDPNGHVNNARYLDWFAEIIPLNILHSCSLTELEIIYKKQIKYGRSITVLTVPGNVNPDNPEYYGEITDDDGNTCALIRSRWTGQS